MNFDFSDEYRKLRSTVKDFTNKEIKPIAQKINDDVSFPVGLIKKLGKVRTLSNLFLKGYFKLGFSQELPIEKIYSDACILNIFEGTNEIPKMIIGRNFAENNGMWKL